MASASGSDIVCVELEDGIAPRDKAKARKHALALYDTQQANDGVELIVRINSLREQFGIEDVAAILATDTPPPALIFPKAAARFFGVFTMRRTSRCKARQAILCVNAGPKLHRTPERKCTIWLDLAGVKLRQLVGFRFVHGPARRSAPTKQRSCAGLWSNRGAVFALQALRDCRLCLRR